MVKMKLFPKRNRNLLPLLAFTVLVLSFSLVNYFNFLSDKVENTQSVLSKSDERNDEKEVGDKVEAKKQEREKVETKTQVKTQEKEEIKKEISSGRIKIDPIIVVKRNEGSENEVEVEDSVESDDGVKEEIEAEFEQESETASPDGTVNKFKLKIKTRTVAGKTIIETASGEMEVENSPEEAVNSLVENEVLDTPTSFEAKTNDNNKVEFEVQGIEAKKLLGLFAVNLPKIVTVDAETGEVTSSNQNVWTRFLSLLSI